MIITLHGGPFDGQQINIEENVLPTFYVIAMPPSIEKAPVLDESYPIPKAVYERMAYTAKYRFDSILPN